MATSIPATRFNYQGDGDVVPMIAKVALEAHRLVRIDATDTDLADYPAAEFGEVFGITLHAADAGEPVDVARGGFALLKVDGNVANIAAGDSIVAHTTTGYGRKVAGGAAGNRKCIGFACAASTADDDLISVEIVKHQAYFAS